MRSFRGLSGLEAAADFLSLASAGEAAGTE
jgi:hypothetical protein